MIAMAAAAVIVGLSGALGMMEAPAAAKGDRIAQSGVALQPIVAAETGTFGAEIGRDASGRIVYVNDPSSRTTTVARGTTVPLTAASPLVASSN